MRRESLLVFLLVVALVSFPYTAGAGGASVSDSNDDCLACHAVGVAGHGDAKVDYTRPAVEYTRCRTCHWQPNHYNHGYGAGNEMLACGASDECHFGAGNAIYFADTPSSFGYFDSPSSLSADADQIHAIHAQRTARFVYPRFLSTSCVACHHSASCVACHGAEPAHAAHTYDTVAGTYEFAPVDRVVSNGYTASVVSQTCVNPACHTLTEAGTPAWVPDCLGCHPDRAGKHGASVKVGY